MSQLRLLKGSSNEEQTFQTVLAEVRQLGFEYCSFGMKSPVPLTAPRVAWCSNYPLAWQQRYEEMGYVRVDPSVQRALHSDQAFLWSDSLFAHNPELYADARAHGLAYGWAQPRRDVHGMTSLFTVIRAEPPISDDELASKAERLQWLSFLCHEAMFKLWQKDLRGDIPLDLSQRELEVLRWSCEGKTSGDIAQILCISEATVNFHSRNACTKLGAANKTAAAVRAAMLGLFA